MKKLIERRAKLVKEGRELLDKADTESRSLSDSEEARFQSILSEVEDLSEEIDEILLDQGKIVRNRKDYSKKENFQDLLADLEKPTSNPLKPEGRISLESDENRLYNKNSLGELRSLIRGQAKMLSPHLELSPAKYFGGLITGDWRDCPNEFQLRALTTEAGSGAVFIPEEISSEVIFQALNKAKCVEAGISITPMSSKTKVLPKQSTEVDTEWKKEGVAFTGSTNLTFVPLTLTCKTLMALIELSVELSEDSDQCGKAVMEAMALKLAEQLDHAILNGAVNGITGVVSTDGILGEAFTDLDYSTFSSAFYKLEETNCKTNSMIIDPAMLGTLDLLTDTLGQPIKPPQSWELFKKFSTNQLNGIAIMGDFSKIILGLRTTMNANIRNIGYGNFEESRVAEDSFKKLNIMIRAYLRADAQIKIPNHICLIAPVAS